jgi:glycogen synthase
LKNRLPDLRNTFPPAELVSKLARSTRLLFVTSEMAGFVKSGGLGEVSAALPRKMSALCDVRVLIPGFRALRLVQPVIEIVRQMPQTGSLPAWSLGRFRTADGLVVYAVLCDELYDREGSPYGYPSGDAQNMGMANIGAWKQQNAAEIRRDFDLEPTRGPLFSIISRLVHQKGVDLSIEAAEVIVSAGGQIGAMAKCFDQAHPAQKYADIYARSVAQ